MVVVVGVESFCSCFSWTSVEQIWCKLTFKLFK